eukprot:TRINITY_DN7837_c1_g1_i2.p1 TRINITY_DN7837_c1_g1~~TRINITY_DN7837_c1_g1_i2.p1  ORF type:complete len:1625 (+),score=431.63 TRINITY_DN7837_c1_g1_i2:370-4875(+)
MPGRSLADLAALAVTTTGGRRLELRALAPDGRPQSGPPLAEAYSAWPVDGSLGRATLHRSSSTLVVVFPVSLCEEDARRLAGGAPAAPDEVGSNSSGGVVPVRRPDESPRGDPGAQSTPPAGTPRGTGSARRRSSTPVVRRRPLSAPPHRREGQAAASPPEVRYTGRYDWSRHPGLLQGACREPDVPELAVVRARLPDIPGGALRRVAVTTGMGRLLVHCTDADGAPSGAPLAAAQLLWPVNEHAARVSCSLAARQLTVRAPVQLTHREAARVAAAARGPPPDAPAAASWTAEYGGGYDWGNHAAQLRGAPPPAGVPGWLEVAARLEGVGRDLLSRVAVTTSGGRLWVHVVDPAGGALLQPELLGVQLEWPVDVDAGRTQYVTAARELRLAVPVRLGAADVAALCGRAPAAPAAPAPVIAPEPPTPYCPDEGEGCSAQIAYIGGAEGAPSASVLTVRCSNEAARDLHAAATAGRLAVRITVGAGKVEVRTGARVLCALDCPWPLDDAAAAAAWSRAARTLRLRIPVRPLNTPPVAARGAAPPSGQGPSKSPEDAPAESPPSAGGERSPRQRGAGEQLPDEPPPPERAPSPPEPGPAAPPEAERPAPSPRGLAAGVGLPPSPQGAESAAEAQPTGGPPAGELPDAPAATAEPPEPVQPPSPGDSAAEGGAAPAAGPEQASPRARGAAVPPEDEDEDEGASPRSRGAAARLSAADAPAEASSAAAEPQLPSPRARGAQARLSAAESPEGSEGGGAAEPELPSPRARGAAARLSVADADSPSRSPRARGAEARISVADAPAAATAPGVEEKQDAHGLAAADDPAAPAEQASPRARGAAVPPEDEGEEAGLPSPRARGAAVRLSLSPDPDQSTSAPPSARTPPPPSPRSRGAAQALPEGAGAGSPRSPARVRAFPAAAEEASPTAEAASRAEEARALCAAAAAARRMPLALVCVALVSGTAVGAVLLRMRRAAAVQGTALVGAAGAAAGAVVRVIRVEHPAALRIQCAARGRAARRRASAVRLARREACEQRCCAYLQRCLRAYGDRRDLLGLHRRMADQGAMVACTACGAVAFAAASRRRAAVRIQCTERVLVARAAVRGALRLRREREVRFAEEQRALERAEAAASVLQAALRALAERRALGVDHSRRWASVWAGMAAAVGPLSAGAAEGRAAISGQWTSAWGQVLLQWVGAAQRGHRLARIPLFAALRLLRDEGPARRLVAAEEAGARAELQGWVDCARPLEDPPEGPSPKAADDAEKRIRRQRALEQEAECGEALRMAELERLRRLAAAREQLRKYSEARRALCTRARCGAAAAWDGPARRRIAANAPVDAAVRAAAYEAACLAAGVVPLPELAQLIQHSGAALDFSRTAAPPAQVGAVIEALASAVANDIQSLDFSGCGVCDEHVLRLARGCEAGALPRLRAVRFMACPALTQDSAAALLGVARRCGALTIADLDASTGSRALRKRLAAQCGDNARAAAAEASYRRNRPFSAPAGGPAPP